MNGGRHHGVPEQYSRAEISIRGLACPFAKFDPATYMSIDACRPNDGFKEARLLFEHIWRKHTQFFRCGCCPKRWSISMARAKVTQEKDEHWKTCEGKRRETPYFDGTDEARMELLDWKQQERFEKVKSIRDVKAKLETLYKACGKPEPETFYVTPSQLGGLFDGFARPLPPGSRLPQGRTTATNLSSTNFVLHTKDGPTVSGANRPPDTDSGYGSMPMNDGDADNLSPTDGYAAQTGTYWSHSAHLRPCGMSGGHVTATSSGHMTNDGENFMSLDDPVYRECFQGYAVDSSVYGSVSSSDRVDPSLLGLTGPGAEPGRGPLNVSDTASFEAEFLEFDYFGS